MQLREPDLRKCIRVYLIVTIVMYVGLVVFSIAGVSSSPYLLSLLLVGLAGIALWATWNLRVVDYPANMLQVQTDGAVIKDETFIGGGKFPDGSM